MAISPPMQARLSAISNLVSEGYEVEKEWHSFPVLISRNGIKKPLTLFKNPAGFSWIGFFFPFAVCTQIKEWSYFYVSSAIFFIASLVSAFVRFDLSNAAGTSLAIMYGLYYPYLRFLADKKNVEENSVGYSIVVGLLLAFVSAIPSLIVDFAVGNI